MKLSQEKRDKIKEQILSIIFQNSPRPIFTSFIAKEIVRDEEFTKALLWEMEKQGWVIAVKKNSKGINYERRTRWRISDRIYSTYKALQEKGIERY